MDPKILAQPPGFLEALGLGEEPLGVFYSGQAPAEGISPKPLELPTVAKGRQSQVDWPTLFQGFSCSRGHIRRATRTPS